MKTLKDYEEEMKRTLKETQGLVEKYSETGDPKYVDCFIDKVNYFNALSHSYDQMIDNYQF